MYGATQANCMVATAMAKGAGDDAVIVVVSDEHMGNAGVEQKYQGVDQSCRHCFASGSYLVLSQ
jgi:hypothetical protein